MRRFTHEEDNYISNNYLQLTLGEMSVYMQRNIGSIAGRMKLIGCIVPDCIIKQRFQNNGKRLTSTGEAHRFNKGNVPSNKGKKMPPEVFAKTAKTQFKKGNMPHNHRPVGSTRITRDGYVEVKVQEPRIWMFKHRVVWEENNGKRPPNAVVKFKDGDTLNCSIDNLYLTDRAGNMKENSYISNYPIELQNIIHVKAALSRQINKKIKKDE